MTTQRKISICTHGTDNIPMVEHKPLEPGDIIKWGSTYYLFGYHTEGVAYFMDLSTYVLYTNIDGSNTHASRITRCPNIHKILRGIT